MTSLPALLARLSEATKGSPELDSAIGYYLSHADYRWWCDRAGPSDFTRSLDAALTLVPEGWEWLTRGNARPFANVMTGAQPVVGEGFTQPDDSYTAYAATAALALCIAALRARSTP